MDAKNKMIRFIDSDYKELFRIPDGESIKIIFTPGDGREPITRVCKYLDETHFETLGRGGDVYHVCQFAGIMERLGARYEPLAQIENAELAPFATGEEKFYTYNREEGNTCAGHIAGDFGQQGDRYHEDWYNHKTRSEQDWSGCAPELRTELYGAVYALRQDLLKNYGSMLAYCESYAEALIDSGDAYKRYGFKLETDSRQYYTQCFLGESTRDARFIIYAYENPAPVLEHDQSVFGAVQTITAAEKNMFYRNDAEGSLCVGYLRGDHGKNGAEFHHNWFENGGEKNTPEFKAEFQIVMDTLRQEVLRDFKSTQDFCCKHPEARLPGDIHRYGFKLETETRQYFVRYTTLLNDYFYVFAYDKAEAVHEQDRHAAARGGNEKPFVMDEIRAAQKAGKEQPPTPKPELGKKKSEPEL